MHRHNFETRPSVIRPLQQELDRVPGRFCDYMDEENNRFNDICKVYLSALSMDDIKYLKPEDLINIVPQNHYEHRLLMTIMVRRYLYRAMDPKYRTVYLCDKCSHPCNSESSYSSDDYSRNHRSDQTTDKS